jgi:putative FmdB family regulatory protein
MLYEYQCDDCKHVQEEMHGMNDTPEILCDVCGKKSQRVITGGTGFVLKGDGWTTTNSKFKESMKKKNEKAGKKAADHHKPITSMGDL